MRIASSKWFLPLAAVFLGVAVFVAQWIGGSPGSGLVSLGIMTAFGAAVLLGGRSETVRGLRGDGSDERFRQIDLRATAFTGLVLVVTVIIAFMVQMAQGKSGEPFTWLGAIGGLAYLAAIVVQRIRG